MLLEWAERADAAGFASLGVLDRVAYGGLDPLVSLAAAAPVAPRPRLVTMVVIGPLRPAAILAKQAASVHSVSGERLSLGVAVGARREDYAVARVAHRGRGRRFASQLREIRRHWEEASAVPGAARSRPEVLVGGLTGEAFGRMARYADGYVHGGGPPRAFASAASRAWSAWRDLERSGSPRLWGQAYFALGPGTADAGAAYLRDYYAFTGPFAEKVAAANLTSPRAVVDLIRGYEDAGCEDLVLLPTVAGIDQVERLAEVLS